MLYSSYSDWQHWGVASIGKMLTRDENGVSYGKGTNLGYLCSALAVAFQCLYQVMRLNNGHYNLGLENKLSKIKEKYIQMYSGDQ